ncbi:MAG TPA: enoyl-ACP reductase [Terriglobales bacterium]|jgi:enoyl-[acyl-carrier protein] reductase I
MPETGAGAMAGKTVLVMGIANRWSLAYAIAQALARQGAELVLTYQGERVKRSVEDLGAEWPATRVYPCDVSQDASVATFFEQLAGDLHGKPLAGVVHSIAFANKEDLERPFAATSRAGFALALDVSAYSLVAVARHAAPLMMEGGAIVTLTYLGATRVVTNYNVMGVAKAALEAEVRYLASELGPQGIRVNAISAGPIKTASARAIKDFSSILDHVAQRAPLRRVTDPAEVGDTAAFLLSDAGRGVTGDVIFVDSGYHILGI